MYPLTEKILNCLRECPQARNSDTALTNYLWINYPQYNKFLFKDKNEDWCVLLKNLYELPTQDDVKRLRAKIQNHPTNPRFLPTDLRIVKQRKINEEFWRKIVGANPELRTI